MNKRNIIIIFIPLMLIILISTYVWLGGLAEIEWQVEKEAKILMVGKFYEGKHGDAFIRETYLDMRERIKNESISGTLSIAYYGHPEEESEEVINFIGAIVTDSTAIPEGYELRLFKSPIIMKAILQSHNIVLPNPTTVYKKASAKASELGYALDSIYFENYHSNTHLEVWFQLK
jgi:hypothetical protein